MGHDSQINSALDAVTGSYTYDTCFSLLKPFIESADIAIGNLEVTLAGPVYKGYPAVLISGRAGPCSEKCRLRHPYHCQQPLSRPR